MEFGIGQRVDALYFSDSEDEDGGWCIAQIMQIKNDKIKIHYEEDESDDNDDGEWINKSQIDKRIAKIHTHTLKKICYAPTFFYIDQQIDVKCVGSSFRSLRYPIWWEVATVIDINNKQIKIHKNSDPDTCNVWYDKNSDQIAKLHTFTLSYINLPKPPDMTFRKMIFYEDNDKSYIIICIPTSKIIYRYAIFESKWEKFATYPQNLVQRDDNEICFDSKKLELYILSKIVDMFYVLNMRSKQCETFKFYGKIHTLSDFTDKLSFYDYYMFQRRYDYDDYDDDDIKYIMVYIPRPFDEIHIISRFSTYSAYHYRISNNIITYTLFITKPLIKKMIWCPAMKRVIGLSDDSIWYYSINQPNQIKYEWKKFKLQYDKLLHSVDEIYGDMEMIIVYKYILFIFDDHYNRIICVDLLNEKIYESYQFMQIYDKRCKYGHDNNYLYLIESSTEITMKRISLFDIIPKELNEFYTEKYSHPLIFGYIARITNKYQFIQPFTYDVVQHIVAFFPNFL